jgi:hypothetical protein
LSMTKMWLPLFRVFINFSASLLSFVISSPHFEPRSWSQTARCVKLAPTANSAHAQLLMFHRPPSIQVRTQSIFLSHKRPFIMQTEMAFRMYAH